MDLDKQLETIKNKYEKYISNPQYKYKSCGTNIVILSLPKNSSNNEKRYVCDERFAKYRADEVYVELIFDKMTSEEINECRNVINYFNGDYRATNYVKHHNTIPDSYDYNDDNVCTHGIHYFNDIEPAFMYALQNYFRISSGTLKYWYDSGDLSDAIEFNKGLPISVTNYIQDNPIIKITNLILQYNALSNIIYDCVLTMYNEIDGITSEGIIQNNIYYGTHSEKSNIVQYIFDNYIKPYIGPKLENSK